MKKKYIPLILKQKNSSYFFSNQKTNSENELFDNKLDGILILMEYLDEELISKCNALSLVEELIALQTMVTGRKSGSDQLVADMAALTILARTREMLQDLTLIEQLPDLPRLIMCQNCNEYGSIIGKTFKSCELTSKEKAIEAIDELFEKGEITPDQKKKLMKQIEQSNLPAYDVSKAEMYN